MRRLILKAIDCLTGRKRGMIDYRAVSTYDYAQIQRQSRRKPGWVVNYIIERRNKGPLVAYFRRMHFSDPRYLKQKAERISRLAEQAMPERVKLQERHARARKSHKRCKHIERELKQFTLQALRGEDG